MSGWSCSDLVRIRLLGQVVELAEAVHRRTEVVGQDEDAAGLDVLPDPAEQVALLVGVQVVDGQDADDGVVCGVQLRAGDVAQSQLGPRLEAGEALPRAVEHLVRDVEADRGRRREGLEHPAQGVSGARAEVQEPLRRAQGEERQQGVVDLLVARDHLPDLGVVGRRPRVEVVADVARRVGHRAASVVIGLSLGE